ncbi:MAG: sensor domain-containing diguanylate cyclase [Candidatus Sulfobium sp.]|jgi:diguanylate cyclase (GGDEF)-like protein
MVGCKDIAVLARKGSVLRFLHGFFDGSRAYKVCYAADPAAFLKTFRRKSPAAVIAEGAMLQKVADKIDGVPTIAVIHGNVKSDIEKAITCQAKSYILKPYLDIDLEYKLASAIADKDTIEKIENERRELEAIVDLTQLLLATLDPRELLYRIVAKVAEIIPVTRCSIIKADKRHRAAFVVASYEDPNITSIRLMLSKYPEIDEALRSGKPIVINDVSKAPLMSKVRKFIEPLGISSILVVPILLRNKVIGTLFLRTSRSGHTFSQNEIRLLNALANASANVLHNAFLFEQMEGEKARLEKLAITDYLTGIYNVRFFYHRIIEEFIRCQRYSLPVSCLMIDIDFFKRINDEYGHKIGDEVLKEFARLLKKGTRKSDVLARYGGEEFILLLTQTALDGAIAEAERIREYVEAQRFRGLKRKGGLTVSVGIAVYPHPQVRTHDDLISCADKALFIAKHMGRNRVAVYQEEKQPPRKGRRKRPSGPQDKA